MRKLASIQKIKELSPIKGADRIEVAKILGWEVVVKKGEFKVGDFCIYFEIDSILPDKPWCSFLKNKDKPEKPIRLKTIRLRGQLSQGLALPLNILDEYFDPNEEILDTLEEGDDLTKVIGVKKYEPEIPACLNGEVKGPRPSYAPKTDEHRVQSFPEVIEEFKGRAVYIGQKVDGTSSTYAQNGDKFDVCGRNWSYNPSTENTYWEMATKYNLVEKLKDAGDFIIQGEIAGPGIQKNPLKLEGHELFVFNVMNLNKEGCKYLDYNDFIEFCKKYELQTVPILKEDITFEWPDVDTLLEEAKGNYANGKIQEGIVIRPMFNFYSEILKGRASFKVINNEYLEKGGE